MIIMYNTSKDKSLTYNFNPPTPTTKIGLTCGDKLTI
jgi:hypothetical protein